MKRFALLSGVLVFSVWMAGVAAPAQAASKAMVAKVPITYQGDTDEAIARRLQFIEGAKKEGQLNWWGILRPNEGGEVIAEFNKIYPFIKVSYWRGKGEEIAAKLEAEYSGGHMTADITLGGEPYNYPRWRKMGMLAKYSDIVPKVESIDKRAYSKYGDWFQPGNNAITPQYNTKLVSAAEAPKRWEDLLDPKWKGQIGMTTDVKVWTTLAIAEGGWGIEKTEAYLKKLKEQKPIWASGHTAGHNLLTAGEFKIMAEEYVYHVFRSQLKGAPVEWARVSTAAVTGPSFTLQKNAPHPNAARLFLEWLFSPQGLVTYEKTTFYGAAAPGSGTTLSKALEGIHLVYRTEEGEIKTIETGLDKRFANILGVTPE